MTNDAARALPQRRGRTPLVLLRRLAAPFAGPLVARTLASVERLIVAGSCPAAPGRR